jgi:hypothetical protein
MSSWGNNDNAANAPYWAVNSTIVNAPVAKNKYAEPTSANVARLYANTTANVYTSGETIGLFAVDTEEIANTEQSGVSHSGWVLKTVGQGGRAGRTQYEVLVALAEVKGDDDGEAIANTANP